MKNPPPTPLAMGLYRPWHSVAATAASTALPPLDSTSAPSGRARGRRGGAAGRLQRGCRPGRPGGRAAARERATCKHPAPAPHQRRCSGRGRRRPRRQRSARCGAAPSSLPWPGTWRGCRLRQCAAQRSAQRWRARWRGHAAGAAAAQRHSPSADDRARGSFAASIRRVAHSSLVGCSLLRAVAITSARSSMPVPHCIGVARAGVISPGRSALGASAPPLGMHAYICVQCTPAHASATEPGRSRSQVQAPWGLHPGRGRQQAGPRDGTRGVGASAAGGARHRRRRGPVFLGFSAASRLPARSHFPAAFPRRLPPRARVRANHAPAAGRAKSRLARHLQASSLAPHGVPVTERGWPWV